VKLRAARDGQRDGPAVPVIELDADLGAEDRGDLLVDVRSRAAVACVFADRHGVPADSREVVTNAIALHHSPGVGLESGPEAFLMSAGAAVDVFGSRNNRSPTRSAGAWSSSSPGWASRIRRAVAYGGQAGPSRLRLVPAPLRPHRPEHPARALP
jgi:hypothetical protein